MLKGVQLRTEFTFVWLLTKKITYELSIGYHVFNQEIVALIFRSVPRPLGGLGIAFRALG